MRKEILNFGVIIRVLVSLIPILLGMPTIAVVLCAYNLAMSFIVFGPTTALVSSLSAICIAMLFGSSFGPLTELSGLVWGIQAILCAAGCVYAISNNKRLYQGLSVATLGILVPQFLNLQYLANKEGMTIAQALVPDVEDIKMLMSATYKQLISAADIDSEMIDSVIQFVHETTTMLIPAVLITVSLVTAYVALWMVSAQLRKMPFSFVHSFSHIKVSFLTSVVSIIMVAVSVVGFSSGNKLIITAALNMSVILLTMCYFSGISLADFYMRKLIKYKLLRIILHSIISLNFFPVYILAAFVDSVVNFRKLPVKVEKAGDKIEAEE